jgi:putative lipoic acid-binding regulatory protein
MSELAALTFPIDFPLKIVGDHSPAFKAAVLEIVRRHAPDFDPSTVELRPSRQNTYLSVTCVIRATSSEQLDALYRELSEHPAVRWAL